MTHASELREIAAWAAELSDAEMELACSGLIRRRYPQGSLICACGKVFSHWAGVTSGRVKLRTLTADGREVAGPGVHAGGWFGEGSLIKNEPRGYDAIALADTELILMNRLTFMRMLEESTSFGRFLAQQLHERLSQFMGMVEHDRMLAPTARVARSLAALLNRTMYPEAGHDLDLTQEEIGLMAGVSRPVANQALKTLHQEGLLTPGYRGIVIHDVERLRAYG